MHCDDNGSGGPRDSNRIGSGAVGRKEDGGDSCNISEDRSVIFVAMAAVI